MLPLLKRILRFLLQQYRDAAGSFLQILRQYAGKLPVGCHTAPFSKMLIRPLFPHTALHLSAGDQHLLIGGHFRRFILCPLLSISSGNFSERSLKRHSRPQKQGQLAHQIRILEFQKHFALLLLLLLSAHGYHRYKAGENHAQYKDLFRSLIAPLLPVYGMSLHLIRQKKSVRSRLRLLSRNLF